VVILYKMSRKLIKVILSIMSSISFFNIVFKSENLLWSAVAYGEYDGDIKTWYEFKVK